MVKVKSFLKNVINKKRLLAVLVLFVLAAVMIFSNPDVQTMLFGRSSVKIAFQSGIEYKAYAYENEMLLVSGEGIRALDEKGDEAWSIIYAMTSPMIDIKDEYIMAADVNGTQINVYKKDKSVWNTKTENEILTAKMNGRGYAAVATGELGYKGAVTVFDNDGKEFFKWHSGSGYIGDIDLASDGTLAVAQLMTDRESIYTRVMFVDTKNKAEARCIGEIDGMVMKLRFSESDDLIAIADCGMFCYDDDGEKRFSTDFGGRIPVDCNIENEDNMVFVFEGDINNTVIESYSERGKLRGRFDADSKIKAFDVNGEYIMLSSVGVVMRISPGGVLKSKIQINGDVQDMTIFSSRDSFISLGGSNAEILKID